MIGGAMAAWFFTMALLDKINDSLGIAAFLLTLFAVPVLLIFGVVRRMKASTVGRPASAIRPEHQNEPVIQYGRTLGEIARAVEAAGKENAPPAPLRQIATPRLRWKTAIAVIIAVLVFLGMLVAAAALKLGGGVVVAAIMTLVSGVIMLFTDRRRVLQPGAEMALSHDSRPPILFLRSFRDDKSEAPMCISIAGIRWWTRIRLEETLAWTLGRLGPFLAVGEPHEGLPQLGAARAYLDEDAWQGVVLHWIRTSRLIVMLAGPTSWIHWEIQGIIHLERLYRLLLVLPPGRKPAGSKVARTRRERWDNIIRSMAHTPFGEALSALDISNVLLVQFRPGRLVVFRSNADLVQDYELALTLAIYGAD